MVDAKLVLLVGGSVCLVVAAVYYTRYRKSSADHYVSYGNPNASCSQLCSIAHPGAAACLGDSSSDGGGGECQSYSKCMNECRLDQLQTVHDQTLSFGSWDGGYGKLL